MSMFARQDDTTLLRMMREQGDLIVQVMAMPEDERSRPGKKGEASPEQAACLNAVLYTRIEAEAVRRGLISERS